MITQRIYECRTPAGTAYCVERRSGAVAVVTPHTFMIVQLLDAMKR